MTNSAPAWLVMYGTLTTIVRAADEDAAYARFLDRLDFNATGVRIAPKAGRIVPPIREEVTIRRPLASDRGWIEDSANPAFLALLPELMDA